MCLIIDCVYVWVSVPREARTKVTDGCELPYVWVLGIKPRPSALAASGLTVLHLFSLLYYIIWI